MPRKLKSALRNPVLQLAFKAAVFAGLLYLAPSHWLLLIVFLSTASYFYFSLWQNSRRFLVSFLALLILSLTAFRYVDVSLYRYVVSGFFGILFFFLLGVKNLVFVRRQHIYSAVNNFLFLIVFLNFFFSQQLFFLKYVLVFLALLLIFREFLIFEDFSRGASGILFASSFAFLTIQFLWAASLLPLGFLNASALILAAVLVFKDLIISHLSGQLNRSAILKNLTVFIIFILIILGATVWSP